LKGFEKHIILSDRLLSHREVKQKLRKEKGQSKTEPHQKKSPTCQGRGKNKLTKNTSNILETIMTQTKIRGKFYPLQHAEWLRACQELTPSQRDVLYYIRTLDPYGNGIAINTAEIARTLSSNGQIVHRQTVSRALKELDRKGFIDLEVIQVNVRVQPKGFWYCQAVDEADSQQAEVVDCQQGEVVETPGCPETPDWIATHPDGSPDTHGTPPLSPPAWISAPPIKTNKTLSEGEEGKEKVKEPELGGEASERLSSQPETFNPSFLVEPKDPVEDKFSAAPRYKTLQQRV
jgi:DNA-binding MarR family transcriptional regulator